MEEKNILDILTDEENEDPIVLYGEDDEEVVFEQVAVIPYEEELYCILAPQDPAAMGVGEDEAIVFHVVTDDDDEPYIAIETDAVIADAVFAEYEKLLEEQND